MTDDLSLVQRLRDPARGLVRADRAEAADAIERLLAEREWQPIASAPKDGADVLVFDGNAGMQLVACYVGWNGDPPCWCDAPSREPIEFAEDLTHWMPLPDPPKESK